jgi:uncharacterized membrane protein YczE
MNCSFVFVQALWMGREFDKKQYLQIPVSVVFSVFLDSIMPLTALLDFMTLSLVGRTGLFVISLLLMGVGLGIQALMNLVLLPGDGMARTLAYKLKWSFGKGKVVNDCLCVGATSIISFLTLRRLEGIQAGTVVSALLTGTIARFFMGLTGSGRH